MPLHPDAVAFLRRLEHDGVQPDYLLTVAEARAKAEAPAETEREPVAAVEDTAAPGPSGPVPMRIYTPPRRAVGVVVYLHGGGFVTGTIDSYDPLMRRLANRVPATVVAVDYRRAPEHRCPAAVDDAQAAYHWATAHAQQLAPDSRGQIAVAGDSAGGNIAAVLSRRRRDAREPLPALQVLLYPGTDAAAYQDSDAYPSYRQCSAGYGMHYQDGLWYLAHYLGPDGDRYSPDASPIRAPSLVGLPAAYVVTVEYDILRDEGEAYAAQLRDAGVPVEHRRWNGHLHGFIGDPNAFADAEPALDDIARAIRNALTPRSSTQRAE